MLLSASNLFLNYGKTEALKDVSFQVEQGQIVSIIGANGAGKSSLLKSIAGLEHCQRGTVQFLDKPLPSAAYRVARLGVILVPEGRRVFSELSVEENLRVGGYLLRDKDELESLRVKQYALFPQLESRRKQPGGTLSGGEQQMLAIARAMMSKPRLLLLDEPSLGLAPLVIQDVFRTVAKIRDEGVTVLLVEQNAQKALEIADFAVVLENGRVRKTGQGKALLGDPEIVEAYLGRKQTQ